jgi:hypothetical protein
VENEPGFGAAPHYNEISFLSVSDGVPFRFAHHLKSPHGNYEKKVKN